MNKLFVCLMLGLFLVGFVSAYYCESVEDNEAVKEFKEKINALALKYDIQKNNLTEKAFNIKLKYFLGCN